MAAELLSRVVDDAVEASPSFVHCRVLCFSSQSHLCYLTELFFLLQSLHRPFLTDDIVVLALFSASFLFSVVLYTPPNSLL